MALMAQRMTSGQMGGTKRANSSTVTGRKTGGAVNIVGSRFQLAIKKSVDFR